MIKINYPARGIVLTWDLKKGWGHAKLVEVDYGDGFEPSQEDPREDVFIHHKRADRDSFKSKDNPDAFVKFVKFQQIEFNLLRTDKGLVADSIKVIGSHVTSEGEINGNI